MTAPASHPCASKVIIGNFPNARCIADSSESLDYAIGARYYLSGRQDSPLIVIRQQAHPAQEEVQYEAEVSAAVHSRNSICATTSGFSQTHSFIFSAVRPWPHLPSSSSGRFTNEHLAVFRCLMASNVSRLVAGTNPARTRAA